jgi:hypothetical protein
MTPQLQACPDINVTWNELIAAAQEMELRSAASRGYLADAASAWTGLKDAYRQPDTETEVHTALEELGEPMQQWQRSLSQAKEAIAGFVAAGKPLQAESEELAAAKLGLVAELVRAERSSDADDDDADRTAARAAAFNDRAERLRTQWQALAEETIAALQGIKGGTAEFLPPGALLGALALPAPAWAGFTSGLDEAFGVLSPTDYLPSLRGLTTEELRAWAQANPEGAALLAGNTLPVWRMPGSAEAVMAKAMEGGNPLTADGIAGIRSAWLGLSPADQERLLLLFPAVSSPVVYSSRWSRNSGKLAETVTHSACSSTRS